MATRFLVALGLVVSVTSTSTAWAQDMTFSLEDAAASTPPPAQRPSAVLVAGLRAYGQERYAEAAVQLQRVVQGDTADGVEGVQRAELHLGKALVHLGFAASALSVFDELTRASPRHVYFDAALPWLAELSARLPDARDVAAVIARYGPDDLDGLDAAMRSRVLFVMARRAYDERELERALALLSRVPTGTPAYLDAQLLAGVTHVRARRARPAIAAFREVLRALDAGDGGEPGDPDALRDLAWLSLGRIYYTAAHGGGDAHTRGQLMGNAVDAWSRVSPQTDYWLDALFESAWALFVSDQHARALGNLHALLSPYFPGAFYPEAYVIKAVTFYHSCQMDNALAVVHGFHRRYGPLREALGELLNARASEPPYQLLADVRAGRLEAPPALRSLLQRSFERRDVRRAVAQLEALEGERKRLETSAPELRASALGDRIRQDVEVGIAFAREHAGDLAKARADRVLAEMQEIANQMDTVEIEILNWKRHTLDTPPAAPRGGGGEVVVDAEHVLWPFDGEYWRDELGYYRQQVSNRCPPR